jgi:hypothetical protein
MQIYLDFPKHFHGHGYAGIQLRTGESMSLHWTSCRDKGFFFSSQHVELLWGQPTPLSYEY